MNHVAITLIKHVFLAIGLVMLAGALTLDSEGVWILALLGVVFSLIGGGLIAHGVWARREEAHLRQHGRLIEASFQRVEVNEGLEVNGENPLRIVAQWHDTPNNRVFVFKSANLWFDPTEFIGQGRIPVYIDPARPTRYHMDLSFMPQVQR